MIKIRYPVDGSIVPTYQIELLGAACCPHLIAASVYTAEGYFDIRPDASGLFHPKTYLLSGLFNKQTQRLSQGLFPEVLAWLRLAAEAVDGLTDYLVGAAEVSYRFDDLYIDTVIGCARLLPAPSGTTLLEGLCGLCEDIHAIRPECHADLAAQRLRDEHAKRLLDNRSLLRLLSLWECEWNSGAAGVGEIASAGD